VFGGGGGGGGGGGNQGLKKVNQTKLPKNQNQG